MNRQNLRGLELVADGSFSGSVSALDANIHGNANNAFTVINMSFKDGTPRPVTITLVAPSMNVNRGNPSVLVEWGSGGFNAAVVIDGREGDQFTLTCQNIRVGIFNDALTQGYNPAEIVDGVVCPIYFGAFASLGYGTNRAGFLKRTIQNTYSPIAANGHNDIAIPKFATRCKFFRSPSNEITLGQLNPFSDPLIPDAKNIVVLEGEDCPSFELAGDCKAIQVRNDGLTDITRIAAVFDLAL